MIQTKLVIKKKIYVSELNGFGVFSAVQPPEDTELVIVGELFDIKEGDTVNVSGELVYHKKYGDQIRVDHFEIVRPEGRSGIEKYLVERIHGVGKKTAGKIVAKFGKETFEVLENHPEKLDKIMGIRKAVIKTIKKSIKSEKTIRELTVKLAPYHIGRNTISKLYDEFGDGIIDIIGSNPYFLIDKIKGIGFKTADNMGKSFGISPDDPNRIRSGIHHIVENNEQQQGNLYVEEEILIRQIAQLLAIDDVRVVEEIKQAISRYELVLEKIPEPVLMTYRSFLIEKEIAERLYRLSALKAVEAPSQDIFSVFESIGIEPSEKQLDALRSSIESKVTIITGGPGTGKTTVIKGIVSYFTQIKKKIALAAPTGRAAKRIVETSGFDASTIHRLLKIDPDTGNFQYNETNPLIVDVVIVDESSMIDTYLFVSLLRALPEKAALILIGDRDQLPSVGPGNILRDIIGSGKFNTIYLDRNFRQQENSTIIENAYRINSGDELIIHPYSDSLDFVMIRVGDERIAMSKVLNIIKYHSDRTPVNSTELQVLVPMYRGDAGITNLNHLIQKEFNPAESFMQIGNKRFKPSDKVMQLKNNYEKEVFNGEQGIIKTIDPNNSRINVEFDGRIVDYDEDELDELTLSYAMSIHKSQGSEYAVVILILLPGHHIMLNREIFYTAVTRAKEKLYLVSDAGTIGTAIRNTAPVKRKTLLKQRFEERFAE